MSDRITIGCTNDLAEWLDKFSAETGRARGEIIRDELQRARQCAGETPFIRLAGRISGPHNLSERKGFSTE